MTDDKDRPTKEYRGYVEIEGSRVLVSLFAADSKAAYFAMREQYGEDAVFSLSNEESADALR